MKIIRNTYPEYREVPHAKPGDGVRWSLDRGTFRLIRISDDTTVFSTAPVTQDGKLRSSGKSPKLSGIIAQVKKHGWVLEVANES